MKQLFTFFCFSICFLSGASVLVTIGWPTYGEGYMYPPPSFFLLIFMFVLLLVKCNNFSRYKYELVGIVLMSLILMFNNLTGRTVPFKAAITGLYTPFMFSAIIKYLRGSVDKKRIRSIFVFFLIINSVIAIFEKLTHVYVLGLTEALGGNEFGFRSHALLGHPLSNSGFVSSLLVFILISSYSIKTKVGLWVLGFLSLLCFNSRFSLVITILFFFLWAIKEFFSDNHQRRGNFVYLFILIVVSVMAIFLFNQGYGDRIVNMGLIDDTSAAVRIEILSIFNYIDWRTLFLGINQHQQDYIMALSGTDEMIIENCWIIFILQYGFFMTVVMTAYFVVLFRNFLRKYSKWQALFVILPWLLMISSSNSIAIGGLGIVTTLLFIYIFEPSKYRTYDSKNNSLLLV